MLDPTVEAARQSPSMDTLTIAPLFAPALRTIAPFGVMVALVVGISLVLGRLPWSILLAAVLALGPLTFIGFVSLWTRNTTLFVGSGYFGFTDALGRRKVFSLSHLRRIRERQVVVRRRRPIPILYLLDLDNRPLFRLSRPFWDSARVNKYLNQLGSPVESDPTPIKSKDVENELKGSKPN
jgi:hypothetical protein